MHESKGANELLEETQSQSKQAAAIRKRLELLTKERGESTIQRPCASLAHRCSHRDL